MVCAALGAAEMFKAKAAEETAGQSAGEPRGNVPGANWAKKVLANSFDMKLCN